MSARNSEEVSARDRVGGAGGPPSSHHNNVSSTRSESVSVPVPEGDFSFYIKAGSTATLLHDVYGKIKDKLTDPSLDKIINTELDKIQESTGVTVTFIQRNTVRTIIKAISQKANWNAWVKAEQAFLQSVKNNKRNNMSPDMIQIQLRQKFNRMQGRRGGNRKTRSSTKSKKSKKSKKTRRNTA